MSKSLKTILITIPIITTTIGLIFLSLKNHSAPTNGHQMPFVQINDTVVEVEIADELKEWWQGLSDRPSLASGAGMLFIFPNEQVRNFWMKNMHFPLDIIWIDGDTIVHISENLPPEGEKPENNYSSVFPVNNVLEVNAGWVEEHGVMVGDRVEYNL